MNQALDYLQTRVANGDADKLTEAELLSLVISNERAAEEIIRDFGGFRGMAYQPLEKFLRYKGLGDARIIRIAACFEMARRCVEKVLEIEHQGRLHGFEGFYKDSFLKTDSAALMAGTYES